MASAIDFLINIEAKAPGAKAVVSNLTAMESKMKSSARVVRNLESAMKRMQRGNSVNVADYRKLNSALTRHKQNLAATTDAYRHLSLAGEQGAGGGGKLAKVLGVVKVAAAAAAVAILAVAAAAARVAVGFGKAVIKGAAFLETSTMAFGALLKDSKAGAAALDFVRRASVRYGLDVDRTAASMKKLLAAQFSLAESKALIKMGADMQAVGATASEVDSVIRALGQIKGKGILQLEELQQQLAETGISVKLVIDNLASSLGKSATEVRAMISAGQISADVGIAAIKATVKQKLGIEKLGQAADKAGGTLAGMWKRFKATGREAILRISEKVLPKLIKVGKPMLDKLMRALSDPATIAKIGKAVEGALATVGKLATILGNAVTSAGELVSKLGDLGVDDDVIAAANDLKVAVDGIGAGLAAMSGDSGGAASFIKDLSTKMRQLAAAVKFLTAPFRELAAAKDAAFSGDIGSVAKWVESINKRGEELAAAASSVGSSIVNGIVSGIKAGAAAVASAVTGVATSAISSAKKVLGIASPSRVFADIGKNTMVGFAKGVDATADKPARAVTAAVGPPSSVSNSRSSRSITIGTITITGVPNAEAVPGMLEQQLASLFEGELGSDGPEPEPAA